jgi:hypothetical protein
MLAFRRGDERAVNFAVGGGWGCGNNARPSDFTPASGEGDPFPSLRWPAMYSAQRIQLLELGTWEMIQCST